MVMAEATITIEFNAAEGKITLQNQKGNNNIATINDNIVAISPNTNKELILRVGLMLQHLGIDIQRLVETSYG